eukprot:TRINITY_DN1011_c0_g1_i3.p1 TRINITY_DN1011_c0_g1~~TRINITY_DN1011_c0_g1_i3.p1  ORF type:complete len:201 (+),score=42.33 TRINITY_DN1011_c0_g1_i3:56-604(+)
MHVPADLRAPIVDRYDDVCHQHNSWDVVRSRKDLTTVRCRECQYQVKMKDVRRCKVFSATKGCGEEKCKDMHVHQQKMSLEERVKKYGSGVLERVPAGVRKGIDSSAPLPFALSAVNVVPSSPQYLTQPVQNTYVQPANNGMTIISLQQPVQSAPQSTLLLVKQQFIYTVPVMSLPVAYCNF